MAVSGIAIISRGVPFTRRNRFILTAGLALGYGATLVPTYFNHVFTYSGGNKSLQGFLDAIVLVMETGFAVTAAVSMILNLLLEEEMEDDIDADGDGDDIDVDVVRSTGSFPAKKYEQNNDSDEIQDIGEGGSSITRGEKQA